MRKYYFVAGLLAFGEAGFSGVAMASDYCSDVLTKSELRQSDFTSQDYYFQHQILSSTSSSSESRKTALSAVISGIPLTLGDERNMLSNLSQSSDVTTVETHFEHAILFNAKAQSQAISMWGDCMDKNAGLRVRFEPQSDVAVNDIVLVAEYRRAPFQTSREVPLTLTSNVAIPPNVQFDDPLGCLKRGHVFQPGDSNCRIQMRVPSAWTHFGITFTLSDSTGAINPAVDAYLPSRAKMTPIARPWPSSSPKADMTDAECLNDSQGACVFVQSSTSGRDSAPVYGTPDRGFIFLERSVGSYSTKESDPNGACKSVILDQTGQRITTVATTGSLLSKGNHAVQCHVSAVEAALKWSPAYQN